ncbi:MAG: archaellin/type IV pilin N-terminal domain-containing protein [Nitrososphaerales archaeon]
MSRKRRGISEILSAVILIMVVVASMAIYVSLSRERIFVNTLSVGEALKNSEDKATELITKILVTKTEQNSTAYLINYGFKNVTIAKVLVDGNKTAQQFNTFLLSDMNFAKPLGKVLPVLPTNSTVKLFVNQTFADRIIMITENGRTYELSP